MDEHAATCWHERRGMSGMVGSEGGWGVDGGWMFLLGARRAIYGAKWREVFIVQHLLRYSGSADPPRVPRPYSCCHSFSLSYSSAAGFLSLSARSFIRSFSKLSQVHANPPSYIQQTPSIYSFELDGSKGKVAGCRCVNFNNAELSTSRLHSRPSLSLDSPVRLSRRL